MFTLQKDPDPHAVQERMQEKNEALRSAATAASKGGSVNEARLQDREHYISSLQVTMGASSITIPLGPQQLP